MANVRGPLAHAGVALALIGCGGGGDQEISPIAGYQDYVVIGTEVYTVDGYQGTVPVYGPPYAPRTE